MVSGKKGDNSLSFPFGIRTSSCFSRVKIWIHEFNYNTLHTIYNYNTYINHFIANEEEKKDNEYRLDGQEIMAIFIGFFFLVVLERKGCLLVFDISEGTETYFDYFGLTSLFNLALEAKRDRKRTFLGYYSF